MTEKQSDILKLRTHHQMKTATTNKGKRTQLTGSKTVRLPMALARLGSKTIIFLVIRGLSPGIQLNPPTCPFLRPKLMIYENNSINPVTPLGLYCERTVLQLPCIYDPNFPPVWKFKKCDRFQTATPEEKEQFQNWREKFGPLELEYDPQDQQDQNTKKKK